MVADKPRWQHYVGKARIAIEALRKPTESMVNAAYAARKRRVSQAGIEANGPTISTRQTTSTRCWKQPYPSLLFRVKGRASSRHPPEAGQRQA